MTYALTLLLAAVVAALPPSAEDTVQTLQSGGLQRTYVLHLPHGAAPGAPVPLVLAFHGHFGNGRGMARLTGFDTLADERNFIVVYPDGVRRSWNDGRSTRDSGIDDVAFAAGLIAGVERRYAVDKTRVYATGMSNGAFFTQRLGCTLAAQLAAIAPVAGSMSQAIAPQCRPARPISVLEIAGTADPLVPYGGGDVSGAPVLSAPASAARWASLDGCDPQPRTLALAPIAPPDGTSVSRAAYRGCRAGTQVALYTVNGAGHTWPSGPQYLPASIIGPVSDQLDASRTIVDFFFANRR